MKKITLTLFLGSLIFSYGCRKCITCEYTDQNGEQITTNETCNKKKDREAFEQELNDNWGEYGPVTCN